MSNVASLVADNVSAPCGPANPVDPRALFVASCRDAVPVFWLFCFDEGCLADVPVGGEVHTGLVSPLPEVGRRLAARDGLARSWFPAQAALWDRWCTLLGLLRRAYLKVDTVPLGADPEDLGADIVSALDWFEADGADAFGLRALLGLAGGARVYDAGARSFRRSRAIRPEVVLVGGGDDFRLWEATPSGKKAAARRKPGRGRAEPGAAADRAGGKR